MATKVRFYNSAIDDIAKGVIDLENDTLKVMLVSDGYTFDSDHDLVDDGGGVSPVDFETNAGGGDTDGYFAGFGNSGRQACTSVTLIKDDAKDREKWDMADFTWTALAAVLGIVGHLIIWKPNTVDTDSKLICVVTPDPVAVPDGNDFEVKWHVDGVMVIRNALS